MKIARIIAGLILILLNVACGDDDNSTPRRFTEKMVVDGLERSYTLNLPPGFEENGELPLVVVLHGFGGQGTQAERDYYWTTKADKEQFAVVYPDGVKNTGRLGLRTWNAGQCCQYAMEQNVDDVKFITSMVEQIAAKYPIDRKRVYATGMSNGGMMVYRLACERSDIFAAIASVSGPFLPKEACRPERPVPALHIHSDLDSKIPFEGGIGLGEYYYPPVDSGLQVLNASYGCQTFSDENIPGKYRYRRWESCNSHSELESYLVYDGGHSWPGGQKPTPRSDNPSTALNATDVIWEFFRKHPRP